MLKNIKVSVIIPAYNVEAYIKRAIESTLSQTYDNIQVIVINDGSTDSTAKIVEQYAARDERVYLINQMNSGVSKARNTGLKRADGRFVIFLDSDDWLEPNTIDYMLSQAENNEEYLICVDRYFAYFDDNQNIYREAQRNDGSIRAIKKRDAMLNVGTGIYNLQSSCYKLFDLRCIKELKLEFREDIYHGEDGLFVYEYLQVCEGIVFSAVPLWNILERPGSATTSSYNSKWLSMIKAVNQMMEYSKDDKYLQVELKKYMAVRLLIIANAYMLSGLNITNDERILKKKMKEYMWFNLVSNMNWRGKIKYILFTYIPNTKWRKIYSVLKNWKR